MSEWLSRNGIDAPAYHGQLENEERQRLEHRLLANDVKALVATVALGMGFDKRDLGFVVHYQRPGSAVAYYQQIGRAGRELEDARVVLLSGHEEDDIVDFFIRGAFPGEEVLRTVVGAVAASDRGLSILELEAAVNAPRRKLGQALDLLEVDGALYKDGSRYIRSVAPWEPDFGRMQRVTAERRRELERMHELVSTDGCGWGKLVARGKYTDERFDDQLVEAAIEMIESWRPEPAPTWVTAVPSLRRPELVPDFAERIARRLGLPYREALAQVREVPQQKSMENSAQQVANIFNAFEAVRDQVVLGEPALLVDDVVDSRWSLTVCGVKLRRVGSGPVFPVALAAASLSD